MKKVKLKKKSFVFKNYYLLVLMLIIINLIILFSTFVRKSSDNILNVATSLINDILVDNINNNIKSDILKKYNVNDLIIINKNNGKIEGVDFNIQKTYDLLSEIKINMKKFNSSQLYYYDYEYHDNYLIINVPFYSYSPNVFISNLGPKIKCQINLIQNISGNVFSKINTYGINSLKLDLYVNLNITSKIVIPYRNSKIEESYDILVASKIIQGEIPSIYTKGMLNSSDIISF